MSVPATSENYLGAIYQTLETLTEVFAGRYQHRQVEPPTETDAYADGDVIFAPIEITKLDN